MTNEDNQEVIINATSSVKILQDEKLLKKCNNMWKNVKKQTATKGTITNLESLFINKKVLLRTAIPTKYK